MFQSTTTNTIVNILLLLSLLSSCPIHTTGKEEEPSENKVECLSYGCPFLPQDVAFDPKVKESLASIRDYCNNGGGSGADKEEDEKLKTEAWKALQYSGSSRNGAAAAAAATLTLIGYKGGPMDQQINQDRAFVVNPFYLVHGDEKDGADENKSDAGDKAKLLGVFDGHGRLGEVVSQYTVSKLPQLLSSKLNDIVTSNEADKKDEDNDEAIKNAIIDTFVQIDKTIPTAGVGGCTASIILQTPSSSSTSSTYSKIYVANAGDSRSFLATYHIPTQTTHLVHATREDKPHLPSEKERIIANNGEILYPETSDPRDSSRVMYLDESTGYQSSIAMSRSIGDWEFGKLGVIPDPIVDSFVVEDILREELERLNKLQEENGFACTTAESEEKKNEKDYEKDAEKTCQAISKNDIRVFAVSATDGLLDYITPEMILSVVASSLFSNDTGTEEEEEESPSLSLCLFSSLEKLIYSAARGWHDEMGGQYRDDIAIATTIIK